MLRFVSVSEEEVEHVDVELFDLDLQLADDGLLLELVEVLGLRQLLELGLLVVGGRLQVDLLVGFLVGFAELEHDVVRNVLVDDHLAGARQHLDFQQILHVRHLRHLRHLAQVPQVHAVPVEDLAHGNAVHGHEVRVVQLLHQVRNQEVVQVQTRLRELNIVLLRLLVLARVQKRAVAQRVLDHFAEVLQPQPEGVGGRSDR